MKPKRFVTGSIRQKLTKGVMLITLAALFISGLINTYYDLTDYRERVLQDLITQADLIGQASVATLQFDDPKVAGERLALLTLRPQIKAARLYTPGATLFAEYIAAGVPADAVFKLPADGELEVGREQILLLQPILFNGEEVGSIYMAAEYQFLPRLVRDMGIVLGVAALALIVSMLMLRWIQSRVTGPILRVTELAQQVVKQRDYSLRAEKTTDDETGYLVDAFNSMLEEIGSRTRELENSYSRLSSEIQERRDAEQALRDSELRYRTLVTTLTTVVWRANARGEFISKQSSWENYTGQVAEQYLGLEWLNAFHPDDLPELKHYWKVAADAAHEFEVELRLWHGESEDYRHVSVRAVPLLAHEGIPLDWMGTIEDVHERVLAQQEISQLNADLERRVMERTLELENANKELEAFSYSVSHDLRSPLRSIDGFALALLEDYNDKLDSTGQDYLARVRAAAQRMGMLIDDMLKLARVTRADFNSTKLDLTGMANEVLQDLRDKDPQRQLDVQVQADLTANGDERLLRIALENLFNNAWKYTGKCERARIEFGACNIDNAGVFYIKDNGAGFDMNHAGRLFGAFQRLHDARDFPGTGVGLATVQRIIRRHGGHIWAEAKVGRGAVFYFTLSPKEKAIEY